MKERIFNFENRKEKGFETPEKTLKSLYKIFMRFHYAGYRGGEQAKVPESVNLNKNSYLEERLQELAEEGKSSIVYRFFKLHIQNVAGASPDCAIEFSRYKDNSALAEEIEKLGRANSFSLSRMRENYYRLEIHR